MTGRLAGGSRKYLIRHRKKGMPSSQVARDLGITARHVRGPWVGFPGTGTAAAGTGRPRACMTAAMIRLVTGVHGRRPAGVARTARRLMRDHDVSYCSACRILKKAGAVAASAAKPGRRKRVRHGRKCPDATWHAGWHGTRDPRFRGPRLAAYPGGASRCAVAARVLAQAMPGNAVPAPRGAIGRFGTPATVLPGNGSCLVGRNGRRKAPPRSWKPTASGAELLDRGAGPMNSRPQHPQTNGKTGRFFRSVEDGTLHRGSMSEYMAYYNEGRLHWSLDIDNYQTPLKAFHDKEAVEAIRRATRDGWRRRRMTSGSTLHILHAGPTCQAPGRSASGR